MTAFATFFDIAWRRRIVLLITLLVGTVVTAVIVSGVRPHYNAQASVLMVAEPSGEVYNQAPQSPSKPILSADLPLLATTPTVLKRVARDIGMSDGATSVNLLQRSVRARLSANSSVMLVRFTGASPRQAIAGANAVAAEVAAFYQDKTTQRFTILIADLEAQTHKRSVQLTSLDEQIQNATAANPYLDTKDGTQALNAHVQKLVADRSDAYASLRANQAAAAVTGRRTSQVGPAAYRDITEADPTYRNLRDQYARDFAEYSRLRAQYSDQYPGLAELRATLKTERSNMLAQETRLRSVSPAASTQYANALGEQNHAQSVAAGDSAKVRALDQAIQSANASLRDSRATGAMLSKLLRDRDVAGSAFTLLSTRLAEARANRAQAASLGSVNVLDRAVFATPVVYTTVAAISAIAIVVIIAAALAIILLVEALDQRFRNAQVIESVYGVPVIGSLR